MSSSSCEFDAFSGNFVVSLTTLRGAGFLVAGGDGSLAFAAARVVRVAAGGGRAVVGAFDLVVSVGGGFALDAMVKVSLSGS